MYYKINLDKLPLVTQCYSVTRNTVWQIADTDHILIFIQEGACSITYENNEYILNPGDIFYIPRNRSYTRRSINGTICTMTYVHFATSSEAEHLYFGELRKSILDDKRQLDNLILDNASAHSFLAGIYIQNKLTPPNSTALFQLVGDIQQFSDKHQLTSGLQSSISLCSILSHISQSIIDSIFSEISLNTLNPIPVNLKKAIQYIHSHYSQQISLDELSAHCNVSKQQLIRYFKSAFHTTPITYITDYKIAKAKDFLFNQPHLTIKEISDELGFNDQHYFTRVFTKTAGESPSEYRHRVFTYLSNKASITETATD